MGEVILTMKDIDKSFPGVHALDHDCCTEYLYRT